MREQCGRGGEEEHTRALRFIDEPRAAAARSSWHVGIGADVADLRFEFCQAASS